MIYKEMAKYQNMSIARAKAIAILEMLVPNLKGEAWYAMEDEIADIINSK